ncbi:Gfo/Idh/MocA family protein [Caulobacter sp. KR2-114]|uniref:Gfo/Idh/MocA family protein n=1 Tax=Caulobacter sp. KR2-114 TaxID=3400912 RepID=UPI003C0FB820
MPHPLRVAIVGLGGVGRLHLMAYAEAQRVRVVAACDLDPAAAALCPPEISFHPDAAAMLAAERPEIVVVATPPASHAALVELAAGAGAHVLCEKPLAVSLADIARMRTACAAAGVQLAYGASYRFLPAIRRARQLIAAGAIGEVMLMREAEIGGAGPAARVVLGPQHYPPGGPGGSPMGLVDHGVHLIDILPWLAGSPVASAVGRGNVSGQPPGPEHLTLTLASGAVGLLAYDEGTWSTALPAEGGFSLGGGWGPGGYVPGGGWNPAPGAIHVHGAAGALRIHHYAHALYLTDAAGVRQIPLDGRPAPHHFADQIDAFAEALAAGRAPDAGLDDGEQALRVLLAAYR